MRMTDPRANKRRRVAHVGIVLLAALGVVATWAYLLLSWWPAQLA